MAAVVVVEVDLVAAVVVVDSVVEVWVVASVRSRPKCNKSTTQRKTNLFVSFCVPS